DDNDDKDNRDTTATFRRIAVFRIRFIFALGIGYNGIDTIIYSREIISLSECRLNFVLNNAISNNIRNSTLQTISGSDSYCAVAQCHQKENTVVVLLVPDAPLFGKSVSVVGNIIVPCRIHDHYRNLYGGRIFKSK